MGHYTAMSMSVRILLVLCLISVAHSSDNPASQFIMIEDLPKEFDSMVQSGNHKMIVRTNFGGSVDFIESDNFHIDINISAPSVEDLAKVHYQYTKYEDAILLQMFESSPGKPVSPLPWILLAIGGATSLALMLSTIFVLWWNSAKRQQVNAKKLIVPDASQAPLLEGQLSQNLSPEKRSRGRKRRPQQSPLTTDEYGSSEDEILREKTRQQRQQDSSRYAYPPTTKVRSLRQEPPLLGSDSEPSPCPGNQDVCVEDEPFPPPPPPEKPVVSYIKLQPDVAERQKRAAGGGQHNDGGYSDYEAQTTLKVKCDDQRHCPEPMPDVIRGQSQGHRQNSVETNSSRDSDYEKPLYSQVNKSRYRPPEIQETPPPPPPADHGDFTQRFDSLPTPPPLQENEYSVIHKPMSGSQMAHILTDKGKGSPQYSHNTSRPPTSFTRPPNSGREPNLEQVELDSVGSSKSGESSKSSGVRTQSSYTDSTYGSDKRAPIFTDSDSAHSTASSANRSRDSGVHGSIRYYVKHPGEDDRADDFHSPSPQPEPGYATVNNTRLVDEAYGTMASNGSGSLNGTNGTNTLRSSASTGSGSSGSVVTVINNDDPMGKPRRRVYFNQGPSPGHTNGGDSMERTKPGGGGGSRSGMPSHYVHTSIVCCLSLICLATGVYTQTDWDTQIHIKIYAPYGYLKHNPELYTRKDRPVQVSANYDLQSMKIAQYEVADAYHEDLDENLCVDQRCSGPCDPHSGDCVCVKGKDLRYTADSIGFCDDIDECNADQYECHEHANCKNYDNYYICECKEGYFGDGNDCRACDAPCVAGTFEEMPCNGNQPKKCKECSKYCNPGYFIKTNCTQRANTVCQVCSARCKADEYEYTPCEGTMDRQCRSIEDLSGPTASSNLIFENRQNLKKQMSYILHQDPNDSPVTHRLTLNRESGFTVTINIQDSNLAPRFRALNHSRSNDNEGFWGDDDIMKKYCPNPVPEKYKLSLVLHQGVTTKASFYDCAGMRKQGLKCERETGYYLSTKEPCHSHSTFGRLPSLNREGWNIECIQPGVLSNLFGVSAELEDVTTMFRDIDIKCAEKRTNCDACSVSCANTMNSHRGSHRCNITGEDADNGESPRLQYCYACCNKRDCSEMCQVYHNPECPQIRCVTGNVAEFVLEPQWSHSEHIFGCEIEPVPDYNIYDVEFFVSKGTDIVNNRRLRARKAFDGQHPTTAKDKHKFLEIFYGSMVDGQPDLVEGDSSKEEFSAGYYQANGLPLREAVVSTREMLVRPRKPFAVSTQLWRREGCDTDLLDELVLADSIQSGSTTNDPYRQDRKLMVHHVKTSKFNYQIFNSTEAHYPFIYFQVEPEESILAAVYDPTTVRDDSSLHAEIQRASKRWSVRLTGTMHTCPGYFNVKLVDSHYPQTELFHYDVGVDCPKDFTLTFHIPTEGPETYEKRYLLEVRDSYKTIKITVVKPAPKLEETGAKDTFWDSKTNSSEQSYEEQGEVKMTVITPAVAVMALLSLLMIFLLFIGFVSDNEKQKSVSENKVQGRHLVFVVGFVTFRTAYSIAVTFTVLLLLLRYVNRAPLNTLVEFGRYDETGATLQKSHIEDIQKYVLEELNRQNRKANETKLVCEGKLQQLQATLEQTKEQMVVEHNEDKLISQVALNYTKLMIQNLTQDMEHFKSDFSAYASKAVEKLKKNIAQTSAALRGNKWLSGAKVIYDEVTKKRRSQGQNTKTFLDWLGLSQEMESLTAELSLKDFPMPDLKEFLNMENPTVNFQPSPLPKIKDITLPRNQWYFHQMENPQPEATPSPGSTPQGEGQWGRSGNSRSSSSGGDQVKVTGSDFINWTMVLAFFVAIDAIWFIHRMAKTYATAKMMLYGCPTFIDCRKSRTRNRGQDIEPVKPASSRIFHFIKDLNLRIMKTEFVPKLVTTVTVCCAIYFIIGVSNKLLSVKALASVGYIESLVAPVETTYQLARTRVKTNAHRINQFEYPFYEELVNMRTKRYQLMLNMYAEVQKSTNLLHDSEFCAWKKLLDPGEQCNCTTASAPRLEFDGCELAPVSPKPYTQLQDFSDYRAALSQQVLPYLNSARTIVAQSCHLILLFVCVLVVVDTLGAVIWLYLKRFNLLRLKPMFEVEHFPGPTANHS